MLLGESLQPEEGQWQELYPVQVKFFFFEGLTRMFFKEQLVYSLS